MLTLLTLIAIEAAAHRIHPPWRFRVVVADAARARDIRPRRRFEIRAGCSFGARTAAVTATPKFWRRRTTEERKDQERKKSKVSFFYFFSPGRKKKEKKIPPLSLVVLRCFSEGAQVFSLFCLWQPRLGGSTSKLSCIARAVGDRERERR